VLLEQIIRMRISVALSCGTVYSEEFMLEELFLMHCVPFNINKYCFSKLGTVSDKIIFIQIVPITN